MSSFEDSLHVPGHEFDPALIEELEKQSLQEMRRLRAHERVDLHVRVTLEPGNASDRGEFRVEGKTEDVSAGGFLGIFPDPPRVGDVYRVRFDPRDLDLPVAFAQCRRCRLVRDGAFEAGFSFFSPISIGPTDSGDSELL